MKVVQEGKQATILQGSYSGYSGIVTKCEDGMVTIEVDDHTVIMTNSKNVEQG